MVTLFTKLINYANRLFPTLEGSEPQWFNQEFQNIHTAITSIEDNLKPATTSHLGLVAPDGTTVTISTAGVLSAVGGGVGTPGGTSGQVQYNNAGALGGFTVSGDGTLVTSTGVLTVTKTNGSPFAPSATVDATNASNISTGTLPAGRLPWPFLAPDGSVTAPSYSWANETNSGFYRAALHDVRYSINGVDVIKLRAASLDVGGSNVVNASGPSFFYPTTWGGGGATGVTIKANRILLGMEALSGTQTPQSPSQWPGTYLGGASSEIASLGVTSQIGGEPIVASCRTSDWRTAEGTASGGAGCYFLAVNDDTGSGTPIASAVNPIGWRASGVTGLTEACQIDVNNAGSVVDMDPHTGDAAGETVALNLTAGTFPVGGALNNPTCAVKIGQGITAKFRKGFVVFSNALDTSVGTGGGGLFADLPRGASFRWVNNTGGIDSELWANQSGLIVNSQINTAAYAIPGGGGFGGTVTQATSLTTAVTLNKICGQVTTFNGSFTSGSLVSFTVNNNVMGATDVVQVMANSSNAVIWASTPANGSFVINIYPLVTATASFTINFMITHGTNN